MNQLRFELNCRGEFTVNEEIMSEFALELESRWERVQDTRTHNGEALRQPSGSQVDKKLKCRSMSIQSNFKLALVRRQHNLQHLKQLRLTLCGGRGNPFSLRINNFLNKNIKNNNLLSI